MSNKRNSNLSFLAAFLLMILAMPPLTQAQDDAEEDRPPPPKANQEVVKAGKQIYEKRCWGCHGMEGAGDGPAVDLLYEDYTE